MRATLIARAWILVILSGGVVQAAMSYLDNGTIKIGIDLNKGGSITYSAPGFRQQYAGTNVVNSYDLAGKSSNHTTLPIPVQPPWRPEKPRLVRLGMECQSGGRLQWQRVADFDPVQDRIATLREEPYPCNGRLDNYPSRVRHGGMDHAKRRRGHSAKPLDDGAIRHHPIRGRLRRHRPSTPYPPWTTLMTYTGTHPFTNGPLTRSRVPFPGHRGAAQRTGRHT